MVYPHSFTTSSKGILNCSPLTLVLNLDSLSYTQASVTRLYSNADAPGCSGLIAPRPSAVLSCHLWNQFDSRVGFTCSKHPLADLIIFRDQKSVLSVVPPIADWDGDGCFSRERLTRGGEGLIGNIFI